MTMNNDFDGPNGPSEENDFNDTPGFMEAWSSSPLLKILTFAAVGIVILFVIFSFGGDEEEKPESRVSGASEVVEPPGGKVDEQYSRALQEADRQRYEEALREEKSVLPTPRGTLRENLAEKSREEIAEEDPLARWRRQAEERERQRQSLQQAPPTQQSQAEIVREQRQVQQNTENALQGMAQAMANQLQTIFGTRTPKGSQIINVTSPDNLDSSGGTLNPDDPRNILTRVPNGQTIATNDTETEDAVETIILPAGEIYYGQISTQANSDVQAPVLATFLTGPLKGSKLIGSFQRTQNDRMIIRFNRVVVDGLDAGLDAIAVDPANTSAGLATDIDYHLLTRVFLPAAAAFVEGLGRAFAQRENTVVVSGDTVIDSRPELNTGGQLATGAAEAANEVGEFFDQEAQKRIQPTITVAAGTPIGILVLNALTDSNIR